MKKLLLITLMLFTLAAKAQTKKPVDSFLGIKFGSTIDVVTAALKLKGFTFDKANSTPEFNVYDGVTLGRRKTSIFYVRSVDSKAYEATFIFKPELEAKMIEYYNDLVKDISEVYGEGKSYKTFKSPYEDGDGYEVTAIKIGKADYNTYWLDGSSAIMATITTDGDLKLKYQDGTLIKVAVERQKAKDKADY